MTFKVKVTIETENGKHKTYQLTETSKATKNEKTGKVSLSHQQPASGNKVIREFSKLYIDTGELEKALANGK